MRIVTAHTNTDFDALAAMVACTCLYPGTLGILPSHVMPGVKAFLAIHQDLLRIKPRKALDMDEVDGLIVVDTNQWRRMDRMDALKTRKDLPITCWDHHMAGTDILCQEEHREEVGATVTLILEEMEQRGTPFTPMQATLFLLGIYHDTGCLTFSSATPRDARMTAFLLENGADLNLVSAYLSETIDDPHSHVFTEMLEQARVIETDGIKVGICTLTVMSGLTMLAALVEKYKTFKGLDAAFGIFATDQDKVMVIARSNPRSIDVGVVVRRLGGGGHPAAGAAVVKSRDMEDVRQEILTLVENAGQSETLVRDMMSKARPFVLSSSTTFRQAMSMMEKAGLNAALICDKDTFLGILPADVVKKASKNNRLDTKVTAGVKRQCPTLHPEDNARTAAARMNQCPEGLLPVMDQEKLLGTLTRGDLILHMYDI